jgi:hypothetical protein
MAILIPLQLERYLFAKLMSAGNQVQTQLSLQKNTMNLQEHLNHSQEMQTSFIRDGEIS